MSIAFKNILANYGSKVWAFISVYLFTPLYIKLLGIESYGIMSFYTVVMGIIVLADVGIASSIDREFAKSSPDEHKLGILYFFEKIYALICISIAVIFILFSKAIATHWLDAQNIPLKDLENYIKLIGIGVGSQMMTIIYGGALMGLQKQVRFGTIQTIGNMIKHVAVIGILYFIYKDVYSFLIWQIVCNLVLIIIYRKSLLVLYSKKITAINYNRKTIPPAIWKYLSGMFFISILNSFNVQIDKLVSSKMLSLESFGYYSLVSVLAQAPMILTSPIILSVFPHFTRKIFEGERQSLYAVFKKFCFLVNAVTIPVVVMLIFFGKSIFEFWTLGSGVINADIIHQITWSLSILSIANLFISFQQIYFYFLLADGVTKYSNRQITFQLILVLPLLVFFINKFGMIGATIPVLIVQLLGFLYLASKVKSILLKEMWRDLFYSSYLLPAVVSMLISAVIYLIASQFGTLVSNVIAAVLVFLISLVVSVYLYNHFNSDKINHRKLL